MLYFTGIFLFLENNILCNVCTIRVHETDFCLEVTYEFCYYLFFFHISGYFVFHLRACLSNSKEEVTRNEIVKNKVQRLFLIPGGYSSGLCEKIFNSFLTHFKIPLQKWCKNLLNQSYKNHLKSHIFNFKILHLFNGSYSKPFRYIVFAIKGTSFFSCSKI